MRLAVALAVAGVSVLGPGAAIEAQVPATDVLHLTGELDVLEGREVGGGGGLEWVRIVSPAWGFTVGAFAYAFEDSQWSYGRLGGYYNWRSWTIVSGEASVGPGRFDGDDSAFQVYKAGLQQALVHKRLYLAVEEQYAAYGRFENPVLKSGGVVYPASWLSAQAHYHVSTGGNVDSSFVSARADVAVGGVGLLAGGLIGRAAAEPPERAARRPRAVETREAFGGVSLPVGAHTLRLVLTVTDQTSTSRYRVLVGWSVPF